MPSRPAPETRKRGISDAYDFVALAGQKSSIWKATARRVADTSGRGEVVEVVVVPAGGAQPTAQVRREVQEFLAARALPGVRVRVAERFAEQRPALDVALRVATPAADPAQVVTAVRAALLAAFALERRALGQTLYSSEIVRVVENVPGVLSSVCALNGDPQHAPIRAAEDCIVHLVAESVTVTVA